MRCCWYWNLKVCHSEWVMNGFVLSNFNRGILLKEPSGQTGFQGTDTSPGSLTRSDWSIIGQLVRILLVFCSHTYIIASFSEDKTDDVRHAKRFHSSNYAFILVFNYKFCEDWLFCFFSQNIKLFHKIINYQWKDGNKFWAFKIILWRRTKINYSYIRL